MKIAIIGSRGYPYVYSGYETFVSELSTRLTNKGHEIYVYCHKDLFSTYPAEVNGIKLIYLPAVEKKSISQLSHSLLSTIHVLFMKMDVILYVNSANGPFGILTKIFRKKTAINVDGLEWLRPKWKGLGAKYFFISSWLSTKVFDEVISDSTEMQKIYSDLFKSCSTVIAYGANIRYSKNELLINKWGVTKQSYYLIVGRLIPDNNADFIVREFCKSNSKKKLVVVGDVPYEDEYARKIKQTKDERVIFTGYIKDQEELAELYHHCYAYFHGHEFGGTNPTMLKALAYGCAIIAIDTVFSREMLNDGQYGLFFKKYPDALSSLINCIECESDQLENYRKISRDRIVNNYTWEKIASQYIDLFTAMTSLPVK